MLGAGRRFSPDVGCCELPSHPGPHVQALGVQREAKWDAKSIRLLCSRDARGCHLPPRVDVLAMHSEVIVHVFVIRPVSFGPQVAIMTQSSNYQ